MITELKKYLISISLMMAWEYEILLTSTFLEMFSVCVPSFLSHQALEHYGGTGDVPFSTHFQEYLITYYQQPQGKLIWLTHNKMLMAKNHSMCIFLQEIMHFQRQRLGRYYLKSKNEFQQLKCKCYSKSGGW